MQKLFIILLIFGLTKINAQLSGSATLNGQSNHSGIKVKFTAASGTSVTDSTFTNSAGNYSINISGGLYTVVFSKAGYQSTYYNNNGSTLLTNTVVLSSINLFAGNVVPVTGTVSGTWSPGNIYVVMGDITIPLGTTLTIQPGAVIKFNGGYTLTASGILNATGSPGNPILFTSNNASPNDGAWYGISITSSSSKLQYCKIEYATTAIEIKGASPLIANNELTRSSNFNISVQNSNSIIKENIIHDYNAFWYSQGITLDNSNCTIECNTIYNGAHSAIRSSLGSSIKNNYIHHMTESQRGIGIECGWSVTSKVANNIIHHCVRGIQSYVNVTPAPTPTITNNTIFENNFGIIMDGFYANPAIIGNTIVNNRVGIYQSSNSTSTPSEVSYNLVWNNSQTNYDGVQIAALGQIVNTNSNGDPIDTYFNLSMDPLFVNNTPPFYSSGSPCISAGKPIYSSNIGANTSAFCNGMVVGLKENTSTRRQIGLYPNPFSSFLTLTGIENNKVNSARFFDLTGKTFEAHMENGSGSSLQIANPDLVKGIYFLELSFSDSSKEYIRVIKE